MDVQMGSPPRQNARLVSFGQKRTRESPSPPQNKQWREARLAEDEFLRLPRATEDLGRTVKRLRLSERSSTPHSAHASPVSPAYIMEDEEMDTGDGDNATAQNNQYINQHLPSPPQFSNYHSATSTMPSSSTTPYLNIQPTPDHDARYPSPPPSPTQTDRAYSSTSSSEPEYPARAPLHPRQPQPFNEPAFNRAYTDPSSSSHNNSPLASANSNSNARRPLLPALILDPYTKPSSSTPNSPLNRARAPTSASSPTTPGGRPLRDPRVPSDASFMYTAGVQGRDPYPNSVATFAEFSRTSQGQTMGQGQGEMGLGLGLLTPPSNSNVNATRRAPLLRPMPRVTEIVPSPSRLAGVREDNGMESDNEMDEDTSSAARMYNRMRTPPATGLTFAMGEASIALPTSPPRQNATRVRMGYRADCEKCRAKVPGHWMHYE